MARIANTVNASYILLVEGEADRGFFEQVCKWLQLNPLIKPAAPKDYQRDFEQPLRNSKQGVLNLLHDLLVELLDKEAPTQRLAIVIDADYKNSNGLGYQETIEQVCKIATDYDFALVEDNEHGLLFKRSDKAAEFGLWVMPNNRNEGMLEDFIKQCITVVEQPLFNHATNIVTAIEPKKFAPHHYSKAEVATWLAWQSKPGHGLYTVVKDDLLDSDHALFQELASWLKQIFT